ncbi:chromate transporter [Acinetobacter calcoaceticus]|uniref:Chromate transporter n=1 Tax=Acinetobacter calcoaceticus TaxID=471 RepID=A0A4R1XNQ1_ACICA|nr:chromate transporter [Acinetobacter calcoaceticus]
MLKPTLGQLFYIFFSLGFTSFGGPAAHFVYFHQCFVEKKSWISATQFSQIMALSQIIPGPSSSQTGMAIGYVLHGYRGACIAWLAFTLPSAVIMALLAVYIHQTQLNLEQQFFYSLMSIVLAIVTFAFWQMLRSYCQKIWQYIVMLLSCLAILYLPFNQAPLIVILLALGWGWIFTRFKPFNANSLNNANSINSANLEALRLDFPWQLKQAKSYLWLVLFIFCFAGLYLLQWLYPSNLYQSLYQFYASSALVFGGGHVILPLLQNGFVNTQLLDAQQFEMGYAFAQLMPGPLFSFAAYIGSLLPLSTAPWINAILASLFIFLPSFFLVFGTLPYWSAILRHPQIQVLLLSVNASVVGLLLALIIPMAQRTMVSIPNLFCFVVMLLCLKFKLPIYISIPVTLIATQLISLLF